MVDFIFGNLLPKSCERCTPDDQLSVFTAWAVASDVVVPVLFWSSSSTNLEITRNCNAMAILSSLPGKD